MKTLKAFYVILKERVEGELRTVSSTVLIKLELMIIKGLYYGPKGGG